MRAAVIRRSGATPALDQFADPQPGQGLSVGTLVAATLNPLDVAIVNDQFPFRRLQPPYIAGSLPPSGVADLVRRCLGLANHRDSVTTFHRPGGKSQSEPAPRFH